jgi:iron complex outermembrane receptor protein
MTSIKKHLLTSTIFCSAMAAFQGVALAQDATASGPAAQADEAAVEGAPATAGTIDASVTPGPDAVEQGSAQDIVVTGTVFRRTANETASPLTVLTAESLERRGLNNVADAVRSVSADNSGSIPTAFAGGFATGASGASLRGLSVNSTLTLFDGLRGANYPLADDGQRQFVDLNTIPNVVVDRVEVLRDGASSTYGADAIGGVINIITKRSFDGVQLGGELGISERGDAAERRFSVIAGKGDLDRDGWSAYVAGEYQKNALVMASDRGFPYNTTDLSSLTCGIAPDTYPCGNGNTGATAPGSSMTAVVRPATQTIPGNIFQSTLVPGTLWQVLSPAGCAPGTIPHTNGLGSFCEQNLSGDYSLIQPRQERFGVTARGTMRVGDTSEAYVMGTYYQNKVFAPGFPSSIRQSTPFSNTTQIVLPALLSNGQLNPNNPFAEDGFAARINYRFADIDASSTTLSRTYRGAGGIRGDLGDNGTYSVEVTGMHTDLDINRRGYLDLAALTAAINNGTYNFVNPSLNSDAIRSMIAPDIKTRATSDLYLAQATVTKDLAELAGGPLQLGGGVSVRREKLDNPSANPTGATLGLNAVSAKGARTVTAAFFEANAPVLDELDLNVSGRYDRYSDGFDAFSPKIGFKFTPMRELALRGTYSRGFRAPQFSETSGTVIGFITAPSLPCNVILAHGGTATAGGGCTGGSSYVTAPASLGLNATGTPDLDPERSQSFTLGAVIQPVRWFSMTLDYYNIRKKDLIIGGPDYYAALANYYAGQPLPAGYTVTLNGPDPEHPDAIQTVSVVNASYVNAQSQRTAGIDFTAQVQLPLGNGLKWSSLFEATRILKSNLKTPSGTQKYAGTQGPYVLSSGAGTPAWRGSWSNSLSFGPATLTATASYVSGYKSVAEDTTGPGTADGCDNAIYDPAFCRTKSFINVDLVGSVEIGKQMTLYVNMLNAFDAKAPFNPANYAGLNYNPTWSQQGVLGRSFRAGARVTF